MRDPRAANLAQILVGYSTRVQRGDSASSEGSSAAEPLISAVYEEVLRAGGTRSSRCRSRDSRPSFFRVASDAQLEWISPLSTWAVDESDVPNRDWWPTPTRARCRGRAARAPEPAPSRCARRLMQTTMARAAKGEHRWVYTLYPTQAYASEAQMSLTEFEDFYYRACLAEDGDRWGRGSGRPRSVTGSPTGRRTTRRCGSRPTGPI